MVTRTATRPVRELSETAEHVARTRDLSRRIDASGDDELSRLAASFNTMLGALERSMRAQRQLVGDASHELRTRLTSLRTNVEVLAGANGSLPPGEPAGMLRAVVGELEELTGLGLAIVRHVAEAHGGTVAARNAEDGGAELCLTLARAS